MEESSSPTIPEKSVLMPDEFQEFERLDRIVRNGVEGMVEACHALEEIRSKRLYRAKFKTFREYCQTYHELTPQYVGRLIAAGKVRQEMETFVSKNGLELELPKAEAVLRELKPIKAVPDRVAVYQEAAATSGKPPTAHEVAIVVKRHLGEEPLAKEKKTPGAPWKDSDRVRTALGLLDDYEAGHLPVELLAECLRDALEGELEE